MDENSEKIFPLYIIADTKDQRKEWIDLLRDGGYFHIHCSRNQENNSKPFKRVLFLRNFK